MKNQRGEIMVATVVIIAVCAFVGGVVLPKLGQTFHLFGETAANKKASFSKQIQSSTPVLLEDKSGRAVAVGTKFEQTYDTGIEEAPIVLTYGQRVAKFFAGVTNLGIIALLAAIILVPGSLMLWMRRWGLKWYSTAKALVKGVKEAPPQAAEEVKDSMAIVMDKKHKKAVDEIKKDLN